MLIVAILLMMTGVPKSSAIVLLEKGLIRSCIVIALEPMMGHILV